MVTRVLRHCWRRGVGTQLCMVVCLTPGNLCKTISKWNLYLWNHTPSPPSLHNMGVAAGLAFYQHRLSVCLTATRRRPILTHSWMSSSLTLHRPYPVRDNFIRFSLRPSSLCSLLLITCMTGISHTLIVYFHCVLTGRLLFSRFWWLSAHSSNPLAVIVYPLWDFLWCSCGLLSTLLLTVTWLPPTTAEYWPWPSSTRQQSPPVVWVVFQKLQCSLSSPRLIAAQILFFVSRNRKSNGS